MGCGYLHICVTVCHFLTDLVVNPSGDEFGERPRERYFPCECGAGCYAYHVCFGYAALYEPLRPCFGELVHFQRAGQVGAQCYYFRIVQGRFVKSGSETAAGVLVAAVYIFLFHDFQ